LAERHYDIGSRELLAVKLMVEEEHQWLEGAALPFLVLTALSCQNSQDEEDRIPDPIIPAAYILSAPVLWEELVLIPGTSFLFLPPSDSHHFTLDPNTANKHLHLSEEDRRVMYSEEEQSYPDHPERFDMWYQVLSREGVSGRCYWEVEWSGDVSISVSYKSINRKGQDNDSVFGCNHQSWTLFCSTSRSSFYHNNNETELPQDYISSRIGVYVDHRAGTLSFYSVSDTLTLLYRVQTTFTQPLYPGFYFCYNGSSAKLL
ncbi:stonustoxin subunit beta-like, partial [Denticeps clupeoides]|uniref:stonustoxin subunit beta-like n=1 Tax=Denticeps clupeoides TaxID=299321 RepID=UPI0010A43417